LLAKTASNFSGAEIEAAVEEGMFTAFDEGAEVNTEHITKALTDTVPLSKTMEEKIEGLRKWAGDRARLASSKEVVTVVGGRRAIEM
jgi:SpoVK/Ycf46/Vps4 family AAA+-type ATPase